MTQRAREARAAFDLKAWLAAEREACDAALERAVEAAARELPDALAEAVRHGVLGGGKRLRPVLCVAAYRAAGGAGDGTALRDLAVSLELIHAYSLMHDDLPVMDDAPLRRGRPTTHRVHGVEHTVLAGAALIPLAALQAYRSAVALGCDEARAREVAGELVRAAGAGGMVGGQALDLLGEGRTLEAGELEGIHALKTGALLTAALRIGARAASADAPVLDALDRYGRSIGLAFQIADDVLDATATAEELGKEPSDEALAKSTYVALHGLEGARRRGQQEVARGLQALEAAGVESPVLVALARYVLERRR